MSTEDRNSELREYLIQNFPTWCDDYSNHQASIALRYWWVNDGYIFRLGTYEILYVNLMNSSSPDSIVRLNIEDLKSNFFSDIYNPTENELVFFELTYGFEWPFQEKNKKINNVSTTELPEGQ